MVADSLSRVPLPDQQKPSVLQVTDSPEGEPLLKLVQEQQREDYDLRDLMNYLEHKE